MVSVKELYYDARPTKSQELLTHIWGVTLWRRHGSNPCGPDFNPNLISHRFPANFPGTRALLLLPALHRGRPVFHFRLLRHTTSHLSEMHFWGKEIWGTSPPRLPNFVHQYLIFIGFRYATRQNSGAWKFLVDSYIFGKNLWAPHSNWLALPLKHLKPTGHVMHQPG